MKKTYIQPAIECYTVQTAQICDISIYSNGTNSGHVDNGSTDPETGEGGYIWIGAPRKSMWDERY